MHMQVEDGLTGSRTDVEHGAVAILNAALAGNIGGDQMAAANEFAVLAARLLQSPNVFLWDHQNMRGRLRIDVFKRVGMLVFVDFLGWNFAADNPAEQTVAHSTSKVLKLGPPTSSRSQQPRGRTVATVLEQYYIEQRLFDYLGLNLTHTA